LSYHSFSIESISCSAPTPQLLQNFALFFPTRGRKKANVNFLLSRGKAIVDTIYEEKLFIMTYQLSERVGGEGKAAAAKNERENHNLVNPIEMRMVGVCMLDFFL
jgi:hypothetical protein